MDKATTIGMHFTYNLHFNIDHDIKQFSLYECFTAYVYNLIIFYKKAKYIYRIQSSFFI